MDMNIKRDAHAVILPAFDSVTLSDSVKWFLEGGGCSILLGESRKEYVARKVTNRRKSAETVDSFLDVTREAAELAGDLLVAVDQEICGICRLHDLIPAFPEIDKLKSIDTHRFEVISASIAEAAKNLGVNCFLGPILDVVTGKNPWLSGRTWSANPEEIARISSAFIRGIQDAGVAATAKHFPGFHNIALDPAIEPGAIVTEEKDSFKPGFIPFTDAIKNGVELIMVGPSIVNAFDNEKPASISSNIISMLRNDFGFKGVTMSDDLDSKATIRNSTVEEVAIEALNAGSDYLLVAAKDNQLERVVDAIHCAIETGDLAEDRLIEAAGKVRGLAKKYVI
jgi:beta-N-acetylhexosaminidase